MHLTHTQKNALKEIVSMAMKQYPHEYDKAQESAIMNANELSKEENLNSDYLEHIIESYVNERINL